MQFLNSLAIKPKKKMAQHFLIDGNILKKIATFAALCPDDSVLEIGPGPGVLTELLLQKGCRVICIEKDSSFAEALKRLQNSKNRLEIIVGDALDADFEKLLKNPQHKKAKIVANIPYSLSTPIVEKILTSSSCIESATLMTQVDFAERIMAEPPSPKFGAFSLFVQFHAKIHFGFEVAPQCFYPPPKVVSSVIRLDMQKKATLPNEEQFFSIIKEAFSSRRKMVAKTLKKYFPDRAIQETIEKLKISPRARPEELSCDVWVSLFQQLSHASIS